MSTTPGALRENHYAWPMQESKPQQAWREALLARISAVHFGCRIARSCGSADYSREAYRTEAFVGYFGYLARQSFKSAPSGERLFYRGGPWSRPYLVPDQATEQRLYIRQLWLMRLLLGVLILGQPLLFLLVPEVIREPLWFLGYLIVVTVVFGVAGHLVFREALRGLQRAPSRPPIRAFYAEMARRHSARGLTLGLLGSLAFVALDVGMLLMKQAPVIAWIGIGIFSPMALAWGYALGLKLRVVSTPGSAPQGPA